MKKRLRQLFFDLTLFINHFWSTIIHVCTAVVWNTPNSNIVLLSVLKIGNICTIWKRFSAIFIYHWKYMIAFISATMWISRFRVCNNIRSLKWTCVIMFLTRRHMGWYVRIFERFQLKMCRNWQLKSEGMVKSGLLTTNEVEWGIVDMSVYVSSFFKWIWKE